jgi:LysM repeat protein
MSTKPPYKTLGSFRKRQRYSSYIIGGLLFVLVGLVLLLLWLWVSGARPPQLSFIASRTPTATITPTLPPPSLTPTITLTPTETEIPPTPTADAPFPYKVQDGDTLYSIAEQFGVELLAIILYNGLDSDVVFLNQELMIPNPDMPLPTATALPENLPRGFEITYLVLPDDTLASIAAQFLSTEDAIIDANEIDDPNLIQVGQFLLVPINLVTAVPTSTPTVTTSPAAATATATP